MTATGDLLETALAATAAGLSVIPIKPDGTKTAAVKWGRYQEERPDEEQVRAWFIGAPPRGLAVIAGVISGNLEMLEFEGRAVVAGLHTEFRTRAKAAGLDEVLTRVQLGWAEKSPSGGFHLIYRCEDPVEGNKPLASRPATADDPGKEKVLIETRGEGGYFIAAPSNGTVHGSGKPWKRVCGGFETVATITAEERRALLDLARSFDEMPHTVENPVPPSLPGGDLLPGDDFNARATWAEILEAHGWTYLFTASDHNQHWRRPGKPIGTSGTVAKDGEGPFYVFTTNSPFGSQRAYSKFAAFAILEHDGDYKAAARALGARGYGRRAATPVSATPTAVGPRPAPHVYTAAELETEILTRPRAIIPGIIQVGLTMLAGKGKLGKSWLALDVALAVAGDGKALESVEVAVAGDVLYLALEDNKWRMQERMRLLKNRHGFAKRLHLAHQWPKLDEGGIQAIEGWLDDHPDAAMVIIDVWKRLRHSRQKGAQLYDEDYEHLVPLQAIALRHDVAVLVVHHTRKSAAEDAFDEISGTGGILAALDACVILHRTRSEADGEVWITGRDIEEAHLAMRFEGGSWVLLGSASDVMKTHDRREVIDALDAAVGGLSPAEVSEALGKPRVSIKQLMWRMFMEHDLVRVGGKYMAAGNASDTNEKRVTGRVTGRVGFPAVTQSGNATPLGNRDVTAPEYETGGTETVLPLSRVTVTGEIGGVGGDAVTRNARESARARVGSCKTCGSPTRSRDQIGKGPKPWCDTCEDWAS